MEAYLIYLGKTAIASAAFYIAFMVLFQNRKQFEFNRIYLLSAMALSFLIPLFTFTVTEYVEAPAVSISSYAYTGNSVETVTAETSMSWWPHYLLLIYAVGVVVFSLQLVVGHYKAFQIVWRSRTEKLFGCIVHITRKNVYPFSFFNQIIIGEVSLGSQNLQIIIEHEKLHVQEKHTFDILVAEILFIFQWFNPFVWLIKNAVRDNLEYKVDDAVIANHDPVSYQMA